MKSLQVMTLATKCIFNCPFCISKCHSHQNKFTNNYEENYFFWKNNFVTILKKYKDLKTVVITGTNEPMQSPKCINNIIKIVKSYRPDIQIELQTRFYSSNEVFSNLDIVAYSISRVSLLNKIKPGGKINRYVILLTDSFNDYSLKDIIDMVPTEVSQITFKVLHDSQGYNLKIDNWILKHSISEKTFLKLKQDIENYNGNLSIRLDENCMESENRYKIFREDGYLYDEFKSIKISKG